MAEQHQHNHPHTHSPQKQPKKLLSKAEKFMLFFALGILAIVILQKFGINMIETTEKIEISKDEQRPIRSEQAPREVNTLHTHN